MTRGFREFKGVTVLTSVEQTGLRAFKVSTSHETLKIRIARDEETEAKVEKVNSLVGKGADILIYESTWMASGKSGIINYLQTIEESK